MTTPSDYSIWLVAQMLKQKVLEAGGRMRSFELRSDGRPFKGEEDNPFFASAHINAHIWSNDQETNEDAAAALLASIPGARVVRRDGEITLFGTWRTGVSWHFFAGTGVCERVQVGTRKVMKPNPDAPLVEVEEPVFETRCIDPLAEAVAA